VRLPRRTPGALFAAVLVVPTVLIAPTVRVSAPSPHPVTPQTQQIAVVDAPDDLGSAARQRAAAPEALVEELVEHEQISSLRARRLLSQQPPVAVTEPMDTIDYTMLGVTWAADERAEVAITVRTRTKGEWTDWFSLEPSDDIDVGGTPNGRLATSPYWAGDSDGVQVRVDSLGKVEPRDVEVDLVDPGESAADAAIGSPSFSGAAFASTNKPNIVTRKQWGADERLRDKNLDMSETVKVGFVHHTAGSNSYGPNEGPKVVRGLYSYYVNSLGYADIGYNFLVDKYGNIYEGRAGSITEPVRQAATGGFNKDTMSVVALGNFQSARASDALVRGIARIMAFRLSAYHRNPNDVKKLRAETGSSRYDRGEKGKFRVVSGHRNAGFTACPGQRLYNRMNDIRRLTKNYMGANLVEPSASPSVVRAGQDIDIAVKSRVMRQQSWTLTISRWCDDAVVRRISGNAAPGNPIRARWNGKNSDGERVRPGRYRLSLASSGGGTTAWPWSKAVSVGVGGDARKAAGSTLARVGGGAYVPVKATEIADTATGKGLRRPLLLGPGNRLDVQVLGRAGVPDNGVSAVALSVEASCASAHTSVSLAPGGLAEGFSRVVTVNRNGSARGLTVARLSPRGDVTIRNAQGAVAVSVTVVGYVSTTGNGGRLVSLPRKALPGARPLSVDAGGVNIDVAGQAGVPSDARAVMLNVRRSANSKVGQVWAWPTGGDRPVPSTWTRSAGSAAAGMVVVPLGGGDQIRVAGDRAGQVSLDVVGYVAGSSEQSFHPMVPRRISREGLRIGRGDTANLSVRGRAGVPASARSVVVHVTGLNPRDKAQLTVWPRGRARPSPANLYIPKRVERDGMAIVRLGDRGDIRVHAAGSAVGTRVIVLGWIGS